MVAISSLASSSTVLVPPPSTAAPAWAMPALIDWRRRSTRPSVYSSSVARAGTEQLASVRLMSGRTASGNERPPPSSCTRPSGRARMPGRRPALLQGGVLQQHGPAGAAELPQRGGRVQPVAHAVADHDAGPAVRQLHDVEP